ncbi:uncharacterized protein TrAtP1_009339 [Trichoderma atroviride]|uniref:uncharacterized protein n=1 Tax=Hypocrea atroviridis TaxID=63577 RepID=UPI00331BB0D9|nr:hypothetical protein TrAtP1_009339 [Trichoderma atroviride]
MKVILNQLKEWETCDEATLQDQMEAELKGVIACVRADETAVNEVTLLKRRIDERERESGCDDGNKYLSVRGNTSSFCNIAFFVVYSDCIPPI